MTVDVGLGRVWIPAWLQRPHRSLVPGSLFTAIIGVMALLISGVERHLFGQEILEPLVLALVIGMMRLGR
jgi:hypothetical protein